MKSNRQAVILEIISTEPIETQYQLIQALEKRGIHTTQATLSRDMHDLHLSKEVNPSGGYRYVTSRRESEDHLQRLQKIFHESVVSYDVAQNLFVLRTLPGLASAACSAIDAIEIQGLVGTLAGDDTAFIAMRDNDAALALYEEIQHLF